jgi:hypothetical protein
VRLSSVLWIGLLLEALGPPRSALADDQDPEALIRDGNALRARGQTARALGLFRRAYDIARTPRTAAQLGLCEFALKSYLEAMNHFSEALATHDAWIDENRPQLERVAAQLRTHLAEITVAGTPAGTVIALDGKLVGTLPTASAWVLPARVSLTAKVPGYFEETRVLDVIGGERREVRLELKPIPLLTTQSRSKSGPPPAANSPLSAVNIVPAKSGSAPPAIDSEGTDRPSATSEPPRPIYQRWWFWTAAGAFALSGTALLIAAHPWRSSPSCDQSPCTIW